MIHGVCVELYRRAVHCLEVYFINGLVRIGLNGLNLMDPIFKINTMDPSLVRCPFYDFGRLFIAHQVHIYVWRPRS